MATNNSTLTADRLREHLSYDPGTGIFTRLTTRPCDEGLIGKPAGGLDRRGYLRISVDNKQYAAHRLAWLCHYGEWPAGSIDHINRIKTDNRIENLRLADPQTQSENRDAVGVSFRPRSRKYHARICNRGDQISIGFFDTWEEAREAYLQRKVEIHPGFGASA